jgi:hypothetical protein
MVAVHQNQCIHVVQVRKESQQNIDCARDCNKIDTAKTMMALYCGNDPMRLRPGNKTTILNIARYYTIFCLVS